MRKLNLFHIAFFILFILIPLTTNSAEKNLTETPEGLRFRDETPHDYFEDYIDSRNINVAQKLIRIRWFYTFDNKNRYNTIYIYDQQGRNIITKDYCDPEDESNCSDQYVFTYNANNILTTEKDYVKSQLSGKYILIATYKFQYDGNLSTGCTEYDTNGVIWRLYKYVYKNGLISRRYRTDNAGGLNQLYVYNYNDNLQLVKRQSYNSVYPSSYFTYEHGKNGISKAYYYDYYESNLYKYGVYEYK